MIEKISLMTFQLLPEEIFKVLNPRKIVTLAKQNGMDYLDIMNISTGAAMKYAAPMSEFDVKCGCYIENVSCLLSDDVLTKKLQEVCEKAMFMGAKKVMLVPLGDGDKKTLTALGKDATFELLCKYFTKSVEIAKGYGITVTFENQPHSFSCLQTAEECVRICETVEGLSIAFDMGLPLSYGADPLEFYQNIKNHVVHVHVRDAVSKGAGNDRAVTTVPYNSGMVPLSAIKEALLADGYDGIWAVEYSRPSGLLHGVKGYTKHLQQFMKFFA